MVTACHTPMSTKHPNHRFDKNIKSIVLTKTSNSSPQSWAEKIVLRERRCGKVGHDSAGESKVDSFDFKLNFSDKICSHSKDF
jgi:hypothetical protein